MYLNVKGAEINSQNSERIKHNMRNGMVRTWVKAYNVLDEGWGELVCQNSALVTKLWYENSRK